MAFQMKNCLSGSAWLCQILLFVDSRRERGRKHDISMSFADAGEPMHMTGSFGLDHGHSSHSLGVGGS